MREKNRPKWILLGSRAKLWLWQSCCCVTDCRDHPCMRWRNAPHQFARNKSMLLSPAQSCVDAGAALGAGGLQRCHHLPAASDPPHPSPLNKGTAEDSLFFVFFFPIYLFKNHSLPPTRCHTCPAFLFHAGPSQPNLSTLLHRQRWNSLIPERDKQSHIRSRGVLIPGSWWSRQSQSLFQHFPLGLCFLIIHSLFQFLLEITTGKSKHNRFFYSYYLCWGSYLFI